MFSLSKRARALVFAMPLLAVPWPLAHAQGHAHQHAHQHGTAQLDIAVEARRITLHFESPLDNLIGFERAPRTEAERRRVRDAAAALRSPRLFTIDPAAQCRLAQVELESDVEGFGEDRHDDEHDKEGESGHAGLEGEFVFDCVDAAKARYVETSLFDFARLHKLQVQVATPTGQFRRDLARPANRIALAK